MAKSGSPGDMGPDTRRPGHQSKIPGVRRMCGMRLEAAPSFSDHQQQVHGGETGDFRLLSLAWITERIVP